MHWMFNPPINLNEGAIAVALFQCPACKALPMHACDPSPAIDDPHMSRVGLLRELRDYLNAER